MRAFTLIESIVVFTIIGFITIFGIQSLQTQQENYFASYYNAFDSLVKASYNFYANPTNNTNANLNTTSGICEALSEYINTTQKNCSNVLAINNQNDFDDNHTGFIATNSMKFYFSDSKNITDENSHQINFIIVYVDLNGEKAPNTTNNQTKIKPDIVPFAITEKGDTIPLGMPLIDTSYMTVRIQLPQDDDFSESSSYADISNKAFGCKAYSDMPETLIFKMNDKLSFDKANYACEDDKIASKSESNKCMEGEYNCMLRVDTPMTRRRI